MQNKIKNKKVIIFDMDGVILDSITIVYEYMKQKYQGMTDTDFKNIFVENFWVGLRKFKEIAKEKYTINEQCKRDDSSKEVVVFPGVGDILRQLSLDYKLVINSSEHQDVIIERLQKNNVLGFFSFIAGKEVSEDKFEKFKIILSQFTIDHTEAIFITDTIGDILDSDKALIDSIAVTWGVHSRVDFEKHDFSQLITIVDDVECLKKIL